MLLLQECWKDLFLLHLCQWSVAWDISHLLTARAATLSPGIETEVRAVLEIISRYGKVLETSRVLDTIISGSVTCRQTQLSAAA